MKIILTTQRFYLREFTITDAPAFFDLNSDWEVMKYTGDFPFENVEAAANLLESLIIKGQYQKSNHQLGRWAICEQKTHEFLGWCGIRPNLDDAKIDLGYRLFQKHWGKGIATEVANATLDYGKNELQLPMIIAQAMLENHASINVLTKIGMERKENIIKEGHEMAYFESY